MSPAMRKSSAIADSALGDTRRANVRTRAERGCVSMHHGVSELWSADRDFTRFPQLAVRNPLMA
jgi:hypothetical protein